MSYKLSAVTIRTNNTTEGMKKIEEIWRDITSGKLPILFNSEHEFQKGISPVSMYSSYAKDETGDYESTVPPAYTKDGKAHCYLYIAVIN